MTVSNRRFTYDNALLLKDAGLVAASAAATVGGVAKVLDLGGQGRIDTRAVIDVTAVEFDSDNELFTVCIQGSNSATFASGVVNLAEKRFGALETTGESADSATGRYELPFTNDCDGTIYEYIRVYTVVVGTIATGINFTAFLAKE